jgi:hypothetical protein
MVLRHPHSSQGNTSVVISSHAQRHACTLAHACTGSAAAAAGLARGAAQVQGRRHVMLVGSSGKASPEVCQDGSLRQLGQEHHAGPHAAAQSLQQVLVPVQDLRFSVGGCLGGCRNVTASRWWLPCEVVYSKTRPIEAIVAANWVKRGQRRDAEPGEGSPFLGPVTRF